MKKLLVVLLTLVLCVATLTSCDFANQFLENFQLLRGDSINVNEAADYIYNVYKDMSITSTDYELSAKTNVGGISYDVTWSVNTDKVKITKKDDNTYVVDVDERSPEDVSYVLTAVITALDRTTAKKQFNLMVPVYDAISHEEYMAAKKDEVVTIAGIVVAINSKEAGNTRNHLFLADADVTGGYYCYQTKDDPAKLGIEVGMTVKVTGPVTPYGDMQEIKDGQIAILDKTIKKVDVVDITKKFAAGESLAAYIGLPVTIKGVEIGTQVLEVANSQYLYFKLNGKTAYVRTYVTDFPTTLTITTDKDGNATGSPDKEIIDKAHAEHFGWEANATGVLVMYGSDYYLVPMSTNCFEYIKPIVKTDADKINDSIDALTFETSFSKDAVVELPKAVYSEVTFAWESNNAAVVVDGNKLTITVPDGKTEVTLTLTATCGQETKTATYTLKLSKVITPVKDIIDIGSKKEHNQYTEEKYIVAGIITKVTNSTYGNLIITDELGNELTIYGTYSADGSDRYDAMESKPVAGDYVVVSGIVGQYNGTPQVKNGWITSFTKPTSVKDAIDIGVAQESYTADKYLVTGVITEVYNTTYGNMYIKDADGNILTIYGTYSATGALRYDALTAKPVAGDTVTIFGVLGQYKGSAQIQNGWIVAHTVATPDEGGEGEGEPTGPVKATIEEAIKLDDGVEVIIVGVVSKVTYNWSDSSKNMSVDITDATGTINAYKLATKVAEGDVITITGKVGSFNNKKQIAEGATAVIEKISSVADATAAEDGTGVVLKVTVDKVTYGWKDESKNMSVDIKDATGTINAYKLYSKVEAGDEIIVIGKVGSFNSKKQIAEGAVAIIVKKAPVEGEGEEGGNEGGDDTNTPAESTVVLEITKEDFNSTSYAANNNTKTENGYSYTSNQVMNQQSTMQWQKSKGYITISSNEFVKLEIKVAASTFTVTVGGTTVTGTTEEGVTTYDLSGLTGEVKISVGSATGKVDYLKFYK